MPYEPHQLRKCTNKIIIYADTQLVKRHELTEQTDARALPKLSNGNQTRVLIVDDELMIRTLAEKILGRAGYSTVTVASGRAAIEATTLWGAEIAVAIVDYSMIGMNGMETMQELKKIAPHITFVVSSGHILGPDDMSDDFTDIVHFLQKPYRARQLAELVSQLIPKS
jgi:two-component system, cell cycle sensor histidine kinase and response regulator CckA